MTDENNHSPAPESESAAEEMSEARRHWEQMHDDECYRDVHGVPSWELTGRQKTCCLAGVALGLLAVAAVVFLLVYLL